MSDEMSTSKVLSGWKEIAQHLGRGVRTVQRWEALGLPVRRPHGHLRSAVCAAAADLDYWLQRCNTGRPDSPTVEHPFERLYQDIVSDLRARIEQQQVEIDGLKREVESLKQQIARQTNRTFTQRLTA